MSGTINNTVTWSLALVPENAAAIDAINRIILGDSYTAEAPVESKKPEAKPEAKKPAAKTQPKPEPEPEEDGVSFEDFKAAAKQAKADHGEEFAMEVLKAAGVKVATTLGRSMAAVDKADYQDIIDSWASGPQETDLSEDEPTEFEEDDFGDDDLDGDDEMETPDADAVKTAVRAYSKEHGTEKAKALLKKHKCANLTAVDKLDDKSLIALFKDAQ